MIAKSLIFKSFINIIDIDYYLGGILVKSEDFISTTNVSLPEIWPDILDEIAKNTSTISFDVWIKTLEIVDIKENVLVLSTPTKSSKSILQKKYRKMIIESANNIGNIRTSNRTSLNVKSISIIFHIIEPNIVCSAAISFFKN